MKTTENKIRKIIRASLKNNSYQQINEIGFLLPPAAKFLATVLGFAGIAYGVEKYGSYEIDKSRIKDLAKAVDKKRIEASLEPVAALTGHAERCGNKEIQRDLDEFEELCKDIHAKLQSQFGLKPNFVEVLHMAAEGIVTADALRQAYNYYGPPSPNRYAKLSFGELGSLGGKAFKKFTETAFKRVAYAGLALAAYDIVSQYDDMVVSNKEFLETLKEKDFKGKLKNIENMYKKLKSGELPCSPETDYLGIPGLGQSFDEE